MNGAGDLFLTELTLGRLRWDLLRPFPRQGEPDRAIGDRVVDEISEFVAGHLDPVLLDDERRLPHRFYDALRASDHVRLQLPESAGGRGLSDFNTFRAVSAAMRVSGTAGFAIGTHNGIGLPALLPALPAGPLRELVLRRLADGVLTGWADTEPAGAANDQLTTQATPIGAGAYAITGDKIFVSNGAVADELVVSASVPGRAEGAGLFLVDTRSAGLRVDSTQQVIGFDGLPLGALRLDRVRVPAERVISAHSGDWRQASVFGQASARGKMYLLSGAALAFATAGLDSQRDFVRRRRVNGRGLAEYPAVQDLIASSVADVFAMDTVIRWCLLGDDTANLTDRAPERRAAKNLTTRTGWRVVDRTMSLLGAEGAETARSKIRRGVPALPVERLLRDARILRITGGVDFAVDLWAAEALLAQPTQPAPDPRTRLEPALDAAALRGLSPRNRDHLTALADAVRRFARDRADLSRGPRTDHEPPANAGALINLGRTVGELLAMAVVLARVADWPADGNAYVQAVADLYCTEAEHRLRTLRPDPADARLPARDLITTEWLHDPTAALSGASLAG